MPDLIRDPRPLSRDELRPGDVLMSRGRGWQGRIVSWLERASYSHGAYWDGSQVIEATAQGIHETPLDDAVADARYVDVYRMRARDGFPLGHPEFPVDPVTAAVRKQIGDDYSQSVLALTALCLLLSRAGPERWGSARFLMALPAYQHLRQRIDHWLRPGKRRPAMICTELVATGFWEADKTRRRYAVEIAIDYRRQGSMANAPIETEDPEEILTREGASPGWKKRLRTWVGDERARQIEERLAYREELRLEREAEAGPVVVVAGDPRCPLPTVSPRDVEFSPSFEFQGRLTRWSS
jgi:hypothetical protein